MSSFFPRLVLVTGTIQFLLWRDKKKAAKVEPEAVPPQYQESDGPHPQGSDSDEKKAVRFEKVTPVSLQ